MDAIKGSIVSISSPVVTQDGSRLWQYGVLVGQEIGFAWSTVSYKIGDPVGLVIGTSNKDHKFTVKLANIG